ncbi:BamA/TamA family outer membrane protein [Vibrio sp. qd031]|uniref:BamA/TamA family outer membrane protein n=1 Tax=Vibrio sp. qd031 TaxID=1603038 RepID=UPI000A116DD7|nr:BamA/TamA family outer membrane protein [Vibrio sp. qd031]
MLLFNLKAQYFSVSVLLATSLVSTALYADDITPIFEHEPNAVTGAMDDVMAVFGAEEQYDESAGMDSSYIPAIYYTPEKGAGIGLLYVGLYGSTHGGTTQPSTLILNPYYSSNGSKGITIENRHFYPNDSHRLYLDMEIYDDAGAYYGVGYQQGQDQNNRLNFAERAFIAEPSWLKRVANNYFLGVGLNYNSTRATDFSAEMDGEDMSHAVDLYPNVSWGGSISGVYDSRDNVANSTQGVLFDLQAGAYHSSETDKWFGEYSAEYAQYHALGSFPGLLAWQVQGEFTSGEVPWNRLPDLGGDNAMRGYLKGRYRDNQMTMTQVEYRVPVYWRLGMVFWGGVGSVAPEVNQLGDNVLTTYGTGFRFAIKDKVNVRADIGFAEDETAFYFHVNEVF